MPAYSYHLKFELYPIPDPTAGSDVTRDHRDQLWSPLPGSSIFDDLPAHPRKQPQAAGSDLPRDREASSQSSGIFQTRSRNTSSDHRVLDRAAGVIDCGASRAVARSEDKDRDVIVLTERQWRARSESFPPPGFAAGIGPRKATKDWRFGSIRIESFDLPEVQEPRSQTPITVGKSYGRGAMAAHGGSTLAAAPAASLGPNLGGPGHATKARFLPLETKNTEAGWGLVHLYRESFEGWDSPKMPTTGSNAQVEAGSSSASASDARSRTKGDDGTILCIPSIPSYLSPSDFLGFVGEKWRGDVCHYRMVMTSRMNRYMVLMKFRDNKRASDWRREFDGKVFNSMEVCESSTCQCST